MYKTQISGCNTPVFLALTTALAGTGSVYAFDRAEEWKSHLQPRVQFVIQNMPGKESLATTKPDFRTAAQHIENIRGVFDPSVSELAALFGVSRQAIYKWLSGDSTPEDAKMARIAELSKIADSFRTANLSQTRSLLYMKAFNGVALADLFKSGEPTAYYVAALLVEAKTMEQTYAQSGFLSSKAKPTDDWRSSVSIPGAAEQA